MDETRISKLQTLYSYNPSEEELTKAKFKMDDLLSSNDFNITYEYDPVSNFYRVWYSIYNIKYCKQRQPKTNEINQTGLPRNSYLHWRD